MEEVCNGNVAVPPVAMAVPVPVPLQSQQPQPQPAGPLIAMEETEQQREQQQQEEQHGHMIMRGGVGLSPGSLGPGPKKRAETWVEEEIQMMLACRKELDGLFNTSKSNKHLWEQISQRMRLRGFERSPTMCKDKWRNLLKDFRKVRHASNGSNGNSNSLSKFGYFKHIEDVVGPAVSASASDGPQELSPASKFDVSSQIVVKDDPAPNNVLLITEFDRSTLNLDQRLDNDSQTTSLLAHDSPLANGMSPWNWRDSSTNGLPQWNVGVERSHPVGRVIFVKWGNITRKIGIDGSPEAIKDVIKCVFGIRSKRAFWLEDEDGVVHCLDRQMPLRTYTLYVDPGLTVKLCYFDGRDPEEKTLFCEDDFHELLVRRGWRALREVGGYKDIETMEELRPLCAYQQGGFKDMCM